MAEAWALAGTGGTINNDIVSNPAVFRRWHRRWGLGRGGVLFLFLSVGFVLSEASASVNCIKRIVRSAEPH